MTKLTQELGQKISELSIIMDDINYRTDSSQNEAVREMAFTEYEYAAQAMRKMFSLADEQGIYDEVFAVAAQDGMVDQFYA